MTKLTAHLLCAIVMGAWCLAGCNSARQYCERQYLRSTGKIGSDLANFYAPDNLARLGGGFGVGAVMAHTDIDEDLRQWWQDDVRTAASDDFADVAKNFGQGEYVIAAGAAALVLGELYPDHPLTATTGEWGDRTVRALLVGAPPMLLMQAVTGASRPGESSAESDWVPLHDSNGVSGHAFMGAVPFITAAQMSDQPLWQGACLAGSTLAGLSRINDDAHYSSQVVLGWWMAYLACSNVSQTEDHDRCYEIAPVLMPEGLGLGVVIER